MYKPRFDPTIEIDKEFLHLPDTREVMTSVNFNYGINTDEERAALLEYERLALTSAFRHHNERCVPVSYIALDEDNKFMIDGRFTPAQTVNLTPGALGVRCEE